MPTPAGRYEPWLAGLDFPPRSFDAVTGQDAWAGNEDNWLGGPAARWWSQADAATYRIWLTQAGLEVTSQQFGPDGDGGHALFWARLQ
jgi:hypothetical protein